VKVLYCEDLANHTSPGSCGGDGNMAASGCNVDRGKRRHVSRTLSSEITAFWVLTLCLNGEGNIVHSVMASYGRAWRSLSILACVDTFSAGIGRSGRNPIYRREEGRWVQMCKLEYCWILKYLER